MTDHGPAGEIDAVDTVPFDDGDRGHIVLTVLVILALGASIAMLFTNNTAVMKIAALAALWAAFLGVFLVSRYRRGWADERRRAQLQASQHAEALAREQELHREQELLMEQSYADAVRDARETALGDIAAELEAMRQVLEQLTGGVWDYQQHTVQVEARRRDELTEAEIISDEAPQVPLQDNIPDSKERGEDAKSAETTSSFAALSPEAIAAAKDSAADTEAAVKAAAAEKAAAAAQRAAKLAAERQAAEEAKLAREAELARRRAEEEAAAKQRAAAARAKQLAAEEQARKEREAAVAKANAEREAKLAAERAAAQAAKAEREAKLAAAREAEQKFARNLAKQRAADSAESDPDTGDTPPIGQTSGHHRRSDTTGTSPVLAAAGAPRHHRRKPEPPTDTTGGRRRKPVEQEQTSGGRRRHTADGKLTVAELLARHKEAQQPHE
ncbi:DUF6779 domain-containing protein [Corynebacterium choanae]|uniref:DUF6779 domain-containing protein n=1 Tax=Corynebacterium choanae TaxID=1862358 RepID=UPI00361D42CD